MRSFRRRALAAYAIVAAGALLAVLFGDPPAWVIAVVAVALAAGMAVSLWAAAAVSGSARAFAGAAREIAAGRFDARVPDGADDDLGRAGGELNRMASRLQSLVDDASQERNRLIAAINSSADAVIAVDGESNVAFANAATRELLGRAPEEVAGKPLVWAVADPAVIEAVRTARETGARSSQVIERPGRQYLRAIVSPIRGGGAWSTLVVLNDMTEVRRVEQVRRDFVANVSHELRTPLAAVKAVLETLEGGALDDPAVARDFLSRADREVDRLVQMVEELLELSRIESGETPLAREPVDIAACVTSAVERLRPQADRAGVSLTCEVAGELPGVEGDAGAIERALVNLVHNAIRFTPAGGSVRVAAAGESGGVAISVADTGAGIDPADLPRVFERFYKADRARPAGGTGLGLALVRHTVEAHGGRVDVESRLGEGSTFRVWLPAAG